MKFNLKQIASIILCFSAMLFAEESKSTEQPLVSIHAEDTHLPSILAILADESGFNIVTGPQVQTQDRLTIHLDEVPIDQAINLVIRAAGLSYEIVGNSILVANKSRMKEDIGIRPHVISLNYANAEEIADLLVDITEHVTIDKTGNRLLVTASPKKIAEVEAIIKEVDTPAIQIKLEARLIEVSTTDADKMGIDWAKLAELSVVFAEAGSPVSLGSDFETGSLIPGFSANLTDTDGDGIMDAVLETIDPVNSGVPESMYFTRGSGIQPFSRQLTAFDLTLDFMLQNNQADILTNSEVVTLNGHEATISMVDVIPYLAQSGGVGGQMQVQQEEVGIKLHILPTVNSDGFITTDVTPEVSSIINWTPQGYPWTKKRQSTTTIRVKDGESIVIAGLLSSEMIDTQDKFPLLWRIPFFGKKFFTHTSKTEKKTDLVIQITPHVIKDNYSGINKTEYHKAAESRILDLPTDSE